MSVPLLDYAERLLRSSLDHMNRGFYDLAVYEAREAAVSALAVLGLRERHSLVEGVAQLMRVRGDQTWDPGLLACCQLLDRVGKLELESCDDACADEIPDAVPAGGISKEEAANALECARKIVSFVGSKALRRTDLHF